MIVFRTIFFFTSIGTSTTVLSTVVSSVMRIDSVFASGHFVTSPLLNLRHLHLHLSNKYEYINLSKLIDISILSKSFPRLVSLWTSQCGLHPDENLAELIISLVTYFEELVEIIINKGNIYRRHGVQRS